jgi:hypothetical protein
VAKRAKPSASSVASKTAALEEKLDGLVQLLQRSQEAEVRSTSSLPLSVTGKLPSQTENEEFDSSALDHHMLGSSRTGVAEDTYVGSRDGKGGIGPRDLLICDDRNNRLESLSSVAGEKRNNCPLHAPPTPAASCTSASELLSTKECRSRANASCSSAPNHDPLEDEAELEEILETYRTNMVTYFPIVVIGKDVTVKELSEDRPFLWLVIRAICSKNSARQAALGIEVRKVLGREMLLEGTKTLDLFLGLLVFAAWGHYYMYNKPIISTVIQLAMSLAFDLGLTKPVPAEPPLVMMNYIAQGCPRPPVNSSKRTMEERRAAIGLFLVSSM